jgi:ribonuclease-3
MCPKNSSDDQLSESLLTAVSACEASLKYQFQNRDFLANAITHASIANTRQLSYERLEFLGDSLLGFVVCEYLFQQYPQWLEGDLTKVKSNVVSRKTCAQIGSDLELEKCIVVGKGVGSKGEVPDSLLANAFESIVAAIYLDGGMNTLKELLLPLVVPKVEAAIEGALETNYKADLQQYTQKRYGVPPAYELVDSQGPDHDKSFKVSARVHKKTYSPAWGKNKKEAEQRAAANALASMDGKEPPFDEMIA